ncbi:uncharacterized protein LOC113227953 [Hyposmocoma kahamanoa]|uniref:uncharacterized protein LOC113227953 n=1 Tax=Hyposmocoma kahamanoa TaxID=1477025 RepID=UPI000E6D7B54|nr:uncharacterized protein LOC113227953 [Hyposmocoma kahamanoa]
MAPRHLPLALRSVNTLLSHSRTCTRITDLSFEMENKHWWWLLAGLFVFSIAVASGEVWEESDHEVLIRSERGAKNKGETCRYSRGAWSECDFKTNFRFRTLTLKKGDPSTCERTKTIQKKCKKPCRYEKSSWSECSADGEMSRVDKLKANSDPACDQSRRMTKKCNKNKQVKATKDKGHRNRQ